MNWEDLEVHEEIHVLWAGCFSSVTGLSLLGMELPVQVRQQDTELEK